MWWKIPIVFISIIVVVLFITLTSQGARNPERVTTLNSLENVEDPLITLAGRKDKESRNKSKKSKTRDSKKKATSQSSGKGKGFIKLHENRMENAPSDSKPINPGKLDKSITDRFGQCRSECAAVVNRQGNKVADPQGFRGNQPISAR